jgi:hypothetical protein
LGERPALADARSLLSRLAPPVRPAAPPAEPATFLAWLVEGLVLEVPGGADLFTGWPAAWVGRSAEVYGVPVAGGEVGAAVRWHGARPALLWESSVPLRLTAPALDPSWSTTESRGEALLRSLVPPPQGSSTTASPSRIVPPPSTRA